MPTFTAPDGITLHYTDTGTGTPILCLAGLTRNGSDFDYVAPHLADHRLIRLDYRGRGKSDWADPETYTIPTEAADALALLDHLGLDRVAILGTSRGGLIGMTLAATSGDRLTGLAMNDIGPVLDLGGLDAIRAYVGKRPSQTDLNDLAETRARLMTGFEDVPDARWQEEARKHYIQTPDGLHLTYDPDLARIFDRVPNDEVDLWPLFDALVNKPVAVIRGANSDLLSAETVAEMKSRRPDLIAAEVPGRGHVPFLDEHEAVAALRAWTARLP